jgi:hypothetical protein
VFLAVYCFYAVGGVVYGIAPISPITLFPIFTIGGTLAVLYYNLPRWISWICVGLNAVLFLAAWSIILFGRPALWWILFMGVGLLSGTAIINISALTQRRER